MAAPDGRAPQLTAGAYGAVVLSAFRLCRIAGEVLVLWFVSFSFSYAGAVATCVFLFLLREIKEIEKKS